MKQLLIAGLAATLLFAACSSGKRMLEKGRYDDAVFKAVNRLQQKPGSRDATATIRQAWPMATAQCEAILSQWQQLPPSEKGWDEVLDAVNRLDALQRSVAGSPVAYQLAGQPAPVTARLQSAQSEAARWYGTEAQRIGTSTNPATARAAFRLAAKSLQLRPQQQEVQRVLRRAYENACTLVNVTISTGRANGLQDASELFRQAVQQQLPVLEKRNFVRFRLGGPRTGDESDERVAFVLQDYVPGVMQVASQVINCVNDSVATEIVDRNGVRREGYRKAKARLTLFEGTVAASVTMSATVSTRNGTPAAPTPLPGSFAWKARWATFTGDPEALTPSQLALTKQPASPPPPPALLLSEAMKPVCAAALRLLDQRYNRGEISPTQWALLNP